MIRVLVMLSLLLTACGSTGPEVTGPVGADIQAFSATGDLTPVAGKVTVFDFGSPWCGACKSLDATLVELAEREPRLAVRKITIKDWDDPVVARHLPNVQDLPYLRIYDSKGKQVATITGLDEAGLRAAIAKAL